VTDAGDGARIVAFFRGTGRDDRGRSITDVHALSLDDLEDIHDYIQWLFPLREPSRAQPQSPVLDDASARAIRDDPASRSALRRSLDVMLEFYGLVLEPGADPRITRRPDFARRARVWLTRGNHNFLRLTRILASLRLLGEPELASALLLALVDIGAEYREVIGGEALGYWNRAVAS
jgi:hypothetical protein